jgi:hypothetical protein
MCVCVLAKECQILAESGGEWLGGVGCLECSEINTQCKSAMKSQQIFGVDIDGWWDGSENLMILKVVVMEWSEFKLEK